MDKKLKEKLDTSNTTDKQDFGIKIVEETPIAILSSDKGHFGVIGKQRITKICDTFEECEKICKGVPTWGMITALIERVVEIKLEKKDE